jgi:phosphatidylserine/phosphatidylglycerophosphate/cardiolipin synthase-like enzyme
MAATKPEHLLQLEASFEDGILSDEERRSLVEVLRVARPLEENLRRVRNRAFEIAGDRLRGSSEAKAALRWLEGVMRAVDSARPAREIDQRVCFSPGPDCLDAVVQRLRASRSSVNICVFTISDDRIAAEILAAHRRGVRVRIISDDDKAWDGGSDIGRLQRSGISVCVDRPGVHMHHKFALFDDEHLLSGSFNVDFACS